MKILTTKFGDYFILVTKIIYMIRYIAMVAIVITKYIDIWR